jgi:hypothetical protein
MGCSARDFRSQCEFTLIETWVANSKIRQNSAILSTVLTENVVQNNNEQVTAFGRTNAS